MPKRVAKDTPENRKERCSYQILISQIDVDHWDFLGSDHKDHGVDYSFEYIENGEYHGYRMLAQIKGRSTIEDKDGKLVFDFPVSTANYAIEISQPFVFFLVDLSNKKVYFLPLQDYFIKNPDKKIAAETNGSNVRIFIPVENILPDAADALRAFAKSQYSYDPKSGKLSKTR